MEIDQYVHSTGYWYKNTASNFHIDCKGVKDWLLGFLREDKTGLIYDLGCGTGYYLSELSKDGHLKLIGVEADPLQLKTTFPIHAHNLTKDLPYTDKGIVICLEVAEHIPQRYEQQLIDNMTKLCNGYLILSWAIPGQMGLGHVNCKDNDYVIGQIESRGFEYLPEITKQSREYPKDICSYFKDTLLVFKKI